MTADGGEAGPAPGGPALGRPALGRRVLAYLGLTELEPEAVEPPVRQIGRPETIGEPIQPSPVDDLLGVSSWIAQARISADGGSAGPLTVRAASVSGRRHARLGQSREDAYAISRTTQGEVIVAVADGVGDPAAVHSAVGAQLAAVLGTRLITEVLESGAQVDATALCANLAGRMIEEARRFIDEPHDAYALATTLTVAWIAPDGTYHGFLIGDGTVAGLSAGGISPASFGSAQGFTETAALPSFYSRVEEFGGRLTPGTALILATDGLGVPMGSPDVAAHLATRWGSPPTIVEFLDDVSFERRGESDDRTAICVWLSGSDG